MAEPSIRVVTPGEDPGGVPQGVPQAAPEPPPAPPQELETNLGGSALQSPTPEQLVGATGGSLAEKMRAKYQSIKGTEEFDVPGWDGQLIIVARAFGDRKAWKEQVSNEAFIAKSTHRLVYVNDDGSREEIEGGWGPKLAAMIGVQAQKASDLVALVISKPNPSQPDGPHIPNVAGIGALATKLVNWAESGRTEAEADLGE